MSLLAFVCMLSSEAQRVAQYQPEGNGGCQQGGHGAPLDDCAQPQVGRAVGGYALGDEEGRVDDDEGQKGVVTDSFDEMSVGGGMEKTLHAAARTAEPREALKKTSWQ